MTSFKLNIQGNTAIIKGLKTFETRVEGVVKKEVIEWVRNTETEAKAMVPVDTSALKTSINGDVINEGFGGKVGSPLNYAPYVEFGTGTRVDVPVGLEKYALQFKANPRIREVNLPARPYLFNNARKNFSILVNNLKRIFG